MYPAWSPDGQYITFLRANNGQSDIYVIDLDAALRVTAERQLTHDAAINDGPSWSPDGRRSPSTATAMATWTSS